MKYPGLTAGDGEFLLNLIGGWERFQQIKAGTLTLRVKEADLLTQVVTTSVPATARFSAMDTFGAKRPLVKLWYLGNPFKRGMLGKVERDVSCSTLTVYTLAQDSPDSPILAQLSDRAEVPLAYVWELLTRQANGEGGILLTNGHWNIFYVRHDASGSLWAVYTSWSSHDGWRVDTSHTKTLDRWNIHDQVISR